MCALRFWLEGPQNSECSANLITVCESQREVKCAAKVVLHCCLGCLDFRLAARTAVRQQRGNEQEKRLELDNIA